MARADRIESGWIARILTLGATLVALVGIGFAGSASADVDFYFMPQIGISGLDAKTTGEVAVGAVGAYSGNDSDASPLIGGSVGLEMPMNEIVPREWLEDIRLPNWPVRFEVEATGLRDYDFRTNGAGAGAEIYSTEIKATTAFANSWMDIPLVTVWSPFQYMFGLGRQPRVRQWLEPGALYFGGGIGMTALEIDGTDNVLKGKDDIIDFAWNVGVGINYAITDRVTFSTGYRYIGLGPNTGDHDVDLTGGGATPGDNIKYDLQVHEFRVGIQIKIFSFRGAWR